MADFALYQLIAFGLAPFAVAGLWVWLSKSPAFEYVGPCMIIGTLAFAGLGFAIGYLIEFDNKDPDIRLAAGVGVAIMGLFVGPIAGYVFGWIAWNKRHGDPKQGRAQE